MKLSHDHFLPRPFQFDILQIPRQMQSDVLRALLLSLTSDEQLHGRVEVLVTVSHDPMPFGNWVPTFRRDLLLSS
jgi:hypothetical protein